MTKAMPFLQKVILLSYDPRPFAGGFYFAFPLALPKSLCYNGRENPGKGSGAVYRGGVVP